MTFQLNQSHTLVGERLRLARIAAGFSTRALAEKLSYRFKLSHATLANYERGDTIPSMEFIGAAASELGRPLNWFLKSGKTLQNVRYRNRKSLVTQTSCVQFEFASQIWLDAYLYVEQQLNEPLLKLKNLNLKDFQGQATLLDKPRTCVRRSVLSRTIRFILYLV